MKNHFFLMVIFCLISNVVYSALTDLDEASSAKLIEYVKTENIERGYWPCDVVVELKEFYRMPNNDGSDIKYFVRAVGFYYENVSLEPVPGVMMIYNARLGRGTEGYFSKEELESLGIQLPE